MLVLGEEELCRWTSVLKLARVKVSPCSCKSSTRRLSCTPVVLGKFKLLRTHAEETSETAR